MQPVSVNTGPPQAGNFLTYFVGRRRKFCEAKNMLRAKREPLKKNAAKTRKNRSPLKLEELISARSRKGKQSYRIDYTFVGCFINESCTNILSILGRPFDEIKIDRKLVGE